MNHYKVIFQTALMCLSFVSYEACAIPNTANMESEIIEAICRSRKTGHEKEELSKLFHNAPQHRNAIMRSFGYENSNNDDDYNKACRGIRQGQSEINPEDIFEFIINNNTLGVCVLLANGVNPDIQNNYGTTPLHRATWYNNKEVINILLEMGGDINARDKYGYTPLHKAVSYNKIEAINTLLEKGANINAQDNDGDTPLHNAAGHYNTEPINILLYWKATNINVQNKRGETPLDCAGKNEIINVLLAHGAKTKSMLDNK